MSTPVPSSSQNFCHQLTFFVTLAGIYAGTASLMGLSPVAGVIIGTTNFASSHIVQLIFGKIKCGQDNPMVKIVQSIVRFVSGIILGAAMATAAGYPITIGTTAILSVVTIPVVLVGTMCILGVVSAVLMAMTWSNGPGSAHRPQPEASATT